ncbi:hypothetical protein RIF29_06553 [Crotalaria pallida]|uniref:Uncharacterized protein n=1 Tax=Crotalaria pallida TaxID=3830 RepID=A0AAN9J4F5_CROPI
MSTQSKSLNCSGEDDNELRRGPWTLEEDDLLTKYIADHGEGRWNLLAKCSGLRRTGKSCRLRWLNYLKPDVKRGNLTPQEQLLILELHSKWGNRWSRIAQQLPGRTDNEIKNYWRTRIQKQARYLNIGTDRLFQEIVKRLGVTEFQHKEVESSPSSAMLVQNKAINQPLDGASTQFPGHGTFMNEAGSNYLDQHEHNNLDSEHISGSSLSSSELANTIPNIPQFFGCSTSQIHELENNDFGSCACDGYHVHNIANEIDAFTLTSTMELSSLSAQAVKMYTSRKKIHKDKDAEPSEFEETVGQALFDLENTNSDLKSDLKDLYINSAVQVDVSGNRKAVVIHVPYRLRKGFRKIHVKLVRELEKKFSGKDVVLIATRRIVRPPKKGAAVQRPRSRTLTAVHEAILEDLVLPAEIVGKRTRYRIDGSKIMKVFLDPKERNNTEYKLETFAAVYRKLSGKDVVFEYPVTEA